MTVKLPPDIEDLDDYTESINILCHADTGAGKTVMWSRLPNVLILAVEEGAVSAKRWELKNPRPKALGLIKVWKASSWAACPDAQARPARPFSKAATRSSSTALVGFMMRE